VSGPRPAHESPFEERDTRVPLAPETVVQYPVEGGMVGEAPEAVDSFDEFEDIASIASLEPHPLDGESAQNKRQAILAGLVVGGSVGLVIDLLLAQWLGL